MAENFSQLMKNIKQQTLKLKNKNPKQDMNACVYMCTHTLCKFFFYNLNHIVKLKKNFKGKMKIARGKYVNPLQ